MSLLVLPTFFLIAKSGFTLYYGCNRTIILIKLSGSVGYAKDTLARGEEEPG